MPPKVILDSELSLGTMGTWRRRSIEKKRKGSQTAGKIKKKYCVTTTEKRYMARRSRSYKDPNYGDWTRWADKANRL